VLCVAVLSIQNETVKALALFKLEITPVLISLCAALLNSKAVGYLDTLGI